MAMKLGEKTNCKIITILSDSKSACISIENTNKNKLNRYYENKIIKIAADNPTKIFNLQWIPAHVGVTGNEIADNLANMNNLHTRNQISLKAPIQETKRIIRDQMKKKWQQDFMEKSLNKRRRHRQLINGIIPNTFWIKNVQLNSKNTRRIARIRTGHTYDKRFFKMIDLIDDSNCDECGELEDFEHIIMKCPKYINQRSKYATLINNRDINVILSNVNSKNYQDICDFLTEINSNI